MKKSLLTILGIACLSSAVAQQTPSPSWSITQNAGYTVTSAGIKFLDALDANTVWMTGYDGQVPGRNYSFWARTFNGGSSYVHGNIFPDTNTYVLANLDGIDECTAWVSAYLKAGGDKGVVYKTTDGGNSWVNGGAASMFSVANTSFADFVCFLDDKKTGVAVGDPIANEFEIYRTTNGGTNWTMVPGSNIPNPLSGEYALVNCYEKRGSNMLWFGTNKNRVYRSTDAGSTWSVSPALTSTLGAALDVVDIAFCTPMDGIANAYFGPTGNGTLSVFTTTDGGANWTELPTIDANYGRNDVCAVPGTTYLASVGAGSGNNIISFSTDGGANWNNWGGSNIQYLVVDFVSPKLGWAGSFASGTVAPFTGGVYKYTGGLLNTAPFAAFSWTNASCPNNCPGTYTMTNYSTGSPAPSYSWSSSGGTIANATATNAVISFSAVGNYTLTMTATSGTTTSTFTTMIPIAVCVGQEHLALDNTGFLMYPNPAGEMLNVEIATGTNFTYTMTDMLGKQVLRNTVQSNKASINVSDLTNGVYFLTVESNGEKTVKKIIVD
jgi:photosystem II stability/assembly factor-like uncharacterized protein